jgi:hypothetical protein
MHGCMHACVDVPSDAAGARRPLGAHCGHPPTPDAQPHLQLQLYSARLASMLPAAYTYVNDDLPPMDPLQQRRAASIWEGRATTTHPADNTRSWSQRPAVRSTDRQTRQVGRRAAAERQPQNEPTWKVGALGRGNDAIPPEVGHTMASAVARCEEVGAVGFTFHRRLVHGPGADVPLPLCFFKTTANGTCSVYRSHALFAHL